MGVYIDIPDTAQEKSIDEHNVNIVNMVNYVAYICNTFSLNFSYAPYPKLALLSMKNDIALQKLFYPKKIHYAQKLCFNRCIMYGMHNQKNAEDLCFSEAKFSYRFLFFIFSLIIVM